MLRGLLLLSNTSAFTCQTLLAGCQPLTGNEENNNKVRMGKWVKLDTDLSFQPIYPLTGFYLVPKCFAIRYERKQGQGLNFQNL